MDEVMRYIIVCPLVFLAGFVDAVAGGGGLISLPAYLISGLPVHMAIGTNKLSSGMGTAIATWRFSREGYIAWKQAVFCAICALIGSNVGARVALQINEDIFKIIMLIILPLTGVYVMCGKSMNGEKEPFSQMKTLVLSMLIALVIGMYDGFYGPGTGTFLILFLTGLAHMKLSDSNGIAKVINLTTNLSALSVFLINDTVLIILGLVAGCFSIAGNYIGTRMFSSGGSKIVKPIMIGVLTIFFVKVLLEVVSA